MNKQYILALIVVVYAVAILISISLESISTYKFDLIWILVSLIWTGISSITVAAIFKFWIKNNLEKTYDMNREQTIKLIFDLIGEFDSSKSQLYESIEEVRKFGKKWLERFNLSELSDRDIFYTA